MKHTEALVRCGALQPPVFYVIETSRNNRSRVNCHCALRGDGRSGCKKHVPRCYSGKGSDRTTLLASSNGDLTNAMTESVPTYEQNLRAICNAVLDRPDNKTSHIWRSRAFTQICIEDRCKAISKFTPRAVKAILNGAAPCSWNELIRIPWIVTGDCG